ncbi:Rha family transcriptional regulator [Vibrio navarrensis]|uniref:Rha family transcriptional regulator n=1 Tax=Vibrio navarrensis TaxID=29495 RepID=UPI001869DFCE|nr:phage regulatory protein/antirepressor Ant [Vibrio navarrensis]
MNVAQIATSKQTPIIRDCQPTMSSREIAELTGKRHPDVKRDIENMMKDLEVDVSRFAHIYLDSMNRKQTEYMLDRDHTECLLTGYSAKARMKVIKRWHELENTNQPKPSELSRMEILQLALESERKCIEQQTKIEQDAHKVEFANTVAVAPDAIDVGKAAKICGIGRNRMFEFLRRIAWITRTNEPYQRVIELGYMDVKISEFDVPEYGLKRNVKALITGKGLLKLQALIQEQLYV